MARLQMHEVEQIRKDVLRVARDYPDQQCFSSRPVEYGTITYRPATGRAKCRVCGETIAKGERAIHFYWDFASGGSYTCTPVWIHAACDATEVKLGKTPRRVRDGW